MMSDKDFETVVAKRMPGYLRKKMCPYCGHAFRYHSDEDCACGCNANITVLNDLRSLQTKIDTTVKELKGLRQEITDQNDPTPLEVYRIANELIKKLEE